MDGFRGTSSPPRNPCLGALGTVGLQGGQRGCGSDFRTTGPCVVPKIANPRNHQGADTNANSRGSLYNLELGSKFTRYIGAGSWTPRLRGEAAL